MLDSSCNETEKSTISDGLLLGRHVAETSEYEVCVKRHMRNRYWHCDCQDPFHLEESSYRAARLLDITRSGNVNSVEVSCATLSGADGLTNDHYGWGHHNPERLTLDHSVASGTPSFDRRIRTASIIWHEVTHTHGYEHTQPGRDCHDPPGFDPELDNAPSIVENCLFTAASGNSPSSPSTARPTKDWGPASTRSIM